MTLLDAAPVFAAFPWPSNAELIAGVRQLGYLRDGDHVLDPTYEKGVWWKQWRPEKLTTHHRAVDGSDFRNLPYPDGAFDAIAYDLPYVCPGGRKTSTVKEMHNRYGMAEGGFVDPNFKTPAELQQIINDGLTEMARLVRPARTKKEGGVIVAKCQNYIWSGDFFDGAEQTRDHGKALGLVVVDRLEAVGLYVDDDGEIQGVAGPQPTVTRCKGAAQPPRDGVCAFCGGGWSPIHGAARGQFHARRNLSTLWVFRKPKGERPGQGALL